MQRWASRLRTGLLVLGSVRLVHVPGETEKLPRGDVLVSAASAAAVVAMLLVLPTLTRAEPGAVVGIPEAGSVGWWLALVTLVAQSAALAWRHRDPVRVAVAIAVAVPVGAAVGLGPAIGLTSMALLIAVYSVSTQLPARASWPALTVVGALVAVGQATAELGGTAPAPQSVGTGLLQAVVLMGMPLMVAASSQLVASHAPLAGIGYRHWSASMTPSLRSRLPASGLPWP